MIKIEKNNINLLETLTSGQCFRVYEESDNSFVVVLNDRVVNIKEENDCFVIKSNNEENLEFKIKEYLDYFTDYESINNEIIKSEEKFKKIIEEVNGYRILNQDSFEMIISYIISQNNNVKRIIKYIEVFSSIYGEKVIFRNKEYYLFPKWEVVKNLSIDDLKPLKIGFRDKYIISFIDFYKKNENLLRELDILDTNKAMDYLMMVKGIGPKVASCILLFGFHRFDTFPIDTWVKKFLKDYYSIDGDVKFMQSKLKKIFGRNSGIAIQYMFHYNRNKML